VGCWDVHFLGVANARDQILCRLHDFVGDFVVGFEQHFDFGVVFVFARFAFCFLGEVHGREVIVCLE
jgi:hypothetical protein